MTENWDLAFSDFGVAVSWTAGGVSSKKGILDTPDEVIGGGFVQSTDYVLVIKSSEFPNLKADDVLSVASVNYDVRSVRKIDDGYLSKVELSKQ